jgi:hypothetical protein
MNRYEILQQLKTCSNFTQLVASGIVSLSVSSWLQIYETYLIELKTNEKSVAIQFTADYYNLSTRQIYKVLSFMEL